MSGRSTPHADVEAARPADDWSDYLYRRAHPRQTLIDAGTARLTLVPYYAWGNREPGRMEVWLRTGG